MLATTLAIALCVGPVMAQDDEADIPGGFNLIEEGAKMLMRGLMSEIEPKIDELRGSIETMGPAIAAFARQMGPALTELLDQVDDLRNYQAPEMLPDGDIIIRRKPDAPVWSPDGGAEAIEL
ncbi:AAA+ family ATPase [Yoonia sp.]|uniref:AAA+ family ATPase n=1 Tax=Yoonia sp. TaxID=2212373 RepID=UPI0025CDE5FC|nr:AAA+ family ATPase [Yoonia sp.]